MNGWMDKGSLTRFDLGVKGMDAKGKSARLTNERISRLFGCFDAFVDASHDPFKEAATNVNNMSTTQGRSKGSDLSPTPPPQRSTSEANLPTPLPQRHTSEAILPHSTPTKVHLLRPLVRDRVARPLPGVQKLCHATSSGFAFSCRARFHEKLRRRAGGYFAKSEALDKPLRTDSQQRTGRVD